MKKMKERGAFGLSISLGDVVIFLSMIASISGLYFSLHEQVAIMNVEIASIKADIQEIRGEAITYRERMKQMKGWQR